MNEVVESKGASKPTPQGSSDPQEAKGSSTDNGEADTQSDQKMAELKDRTHPFD
jgi:hypothetical protein